MGITKIIIGNFIQRQNLFHGMRQSCMKRLKAIVVRSVQIQSNSIQSKLLNQSNSNRKLIKTVKVWIGLNFVFHKLLGLDQISDLIFKIDPIQSKLNNII